MEVETSRMNDTATDSMMYKCSTPRNHTPTNGSADKSLQQSNDANNNMDDFNLSCDLLRSSKIDLDHLNQSDESNTQNFSSLLNFNDLNNEPNNENDASALLVKVKKSAPPPCKLSPLNQAEFMLKNIRSNYKSATGNHLGNHNANLNNKSDEIDFSDSLTQSKFMNELNTKMRPTGENNDKGQNANKILSPKYFMKYHNDEQSDENTLEIEKEIVKRQHCERQIQELNKQKLELEQQLAVATSLNHKKEIFIQKMDKELEKIVDYWKAREEENVKSMHKLQQDKEIALVNELNCINRVKFLEEEMRQLNNDLVNEKQRFQEYQKERSSEITMLKKEYIELQRNDLDKTSKLEAFQNQVTQFRDERDSLQQTITNLNRKIEEDKSKYESKESELNVKINELTGANHKLTSQHAKIENEYDQLMKEAKIVVQESEVQYTQLMEKLELEKRSKDALQVQITVLEERLDKTVELMKYESDNKIKTLETNFAEKERVMSEKHRLELNDLNSKMKMEIESLKSRFYSEMDAKVNDYEDKIKVLTKKVEMQQSELNSLTETNKALESDRNSIRQNLKNMLEMQMKEVMQLVGLSSSMNDTNMASSNAKNSLFSNINATGNNNELNYTDLYSSKYSFNYEIPKTANLSLTLPKSSEFSSYEPAKNSLLTQSFSVPAFDKDQTNSTINFEPLKIDTSKPIDTKKTDLSDEKNSIKDLFIKYQIDMINKCYDIDSQTISTKPADSTKASNIDTSNLFDFKYTPQSLSVTPSQSNLQLNQATSFQSLKAPSNESINKNNEMKMNINELMTKSSSHINSAAFNSSTPAKQALNSSRSNELRYFIEMLLDKSPENSTSTKIAVPNTVNSNPMAQNRLTTRENEFISNIQSLNQSLKTPPQQMKPKSSKGQVNTYSYNSASELDDDEREFYSVSRNKYNGSFEDFNELESNTMESQTFDELKRNLNFEFNQMTPPTHESIKLTHAENKGDAKMESKKEQLQKQRAPIKQQQPISSEPPKKSMAAKPNNQLQGSSTSLKSTSLSTSCTNLKDTSCIEKAKQQKQPLKRVWK